MENLIFTIIILSFFIHGFMKLNIKKEFKITRELISENESSISILDINQLNGSIRYKTIESDLSDLIKYYNESIDSYDDALNKIINKQIRHGKNLGTINARVIEQSHAVNEIIKEAVVSLGLIEKAYSSIDATKSFTGEKIKGFSLIGKIEELESNKLNKTSKQK